MWAFAESSILVDPSRIQWIISVRAPLLSLSNRAIESLIPFGDEMTTPPGEPIVSENEPLSRAAIFKSGDASVYLRCGLPVCMARKVRPGEIIGISEMLTRQPSFVSVIAESDCSTVMISRNRLTDALTANRSLRRQLIFKLSTEIGSALRISSHL